MKTECILPLPAAGYMPHRKPMQLVDTLLEATVEGAGAAMAKIEEDCLLLDPAGRLAAVSIVELIAQAYAAVKGYADQLAGKPCGKGFLVGVQKSEFRQTVRKGDVLRIEVETVGKFENFSVVNGRVLRGEDVLGTASIKVFSVETG